VYTLARRLMVDVQQAKEVTQDTFIDVIERAWTVESPAAFVAWVRAVAVNHCLMRLRSPWHQRRAQGGVDADRDLASDAGRLEGLTDLERALARLAPETRFVVWMHDVEGHTHAEIAALVGRTASYSKSQLMRAYAQLAAWSSGVAAARDTARGEEPSAARESALSGKPDGEATRSNLVAPSG
jgi:RNA polymerase sigma-70 factor (ECF subfamily)